MNGKLSKYLELYSKAGLSIIPLRYRDKKPLSDWKEYQERRPSREEIEKWFRTDKANVGIITGRVSNNLIVIDFDDKEKFKWFMDRLQREEGLLYAVLNHTWIVETGKGYHVYLRLRNGIERTHVRLVEGVDVKGEGGYVVAPPSIHPSGKQYVFLDEELVFEDVRRIVELEKEDWERLLSYLGARKEDDKKGTKALEFNGGNERQGIKTVFKELKENDILKIVNLLAEAWREGVRQDLALFLSGWTAKAHIHPISIAKVLKLLEERNENPELEERLSTIYYSYRKALGRAVDEELEKLDRLIDEWRDQEVITKNVSKGKSYDEIVKGKTGVQEILQRVLSENEALAIIKDIQDILGVASPFYDPTTIMVDFEKRIGYTNYPAYKRIYRVKIEEDELKHKIKLVSPMWEGAIEKLIVYENPLDNTIKFELTWVSKLREGIPLKIGPSGIEEIYDILKSSNYLINKRYGEEALRNVVNALILKGKAERRKEIDVSGFFILDNRLVVSNWEVRQVSRGELREALLLLNELADKWFRRVIDRFSTVIKLGVIGPFVFARKQLGKRYYIPAPVLYGARDTGKTSMLEIACIYMWGVDKFEHFKSGYGANTEPRLGKAVSTDTFCMLIDEAYPIFQHKSLPNMVKVIIEKTKAREKLTKTGGVIEIYAYNFPTFTINPDEDEPIDFTKHDLVPKTIWPLYFSEDEKLSREEKKAYNKEVEPRLEKLEAIGHFIARKMLEGGIELLKKDWRDLSKGLLEEAYRTAGLEPPEWINLWAEYPSFEEMAEEKIERIRVKLINYINEIYSRNISRIYAYDTGSPIDPEKIDLKTKLNILLRNRIIPFMILKNDKVYITKSIIRELKLPIGDLKDLAYLLKWRYIPSKTLRIGEKRTSYSVLETSLEKIEDFLITYIEEEMS